ncbi:MAG: hypothetical protein FJ290_11755 [Planctomycetes bacterium]|nr:hypothetical protein [Planctomycetota bacterium]
MPVVWRVCGPLACALLLGLAGCSSAAFYKLPTRQEMTAKTTQALVREFHDLRAYRPSAARYILTPVFDMPPVDPLIEAWGEPQSRRLSWVNLIPAFIVFHPTWVYRWEFTDKEAVAVVDCPLLFGYQPHVWSLRLRDRGK